MKPEFRKALADSLFIHFPLECDGKGSLDDEALSKEVLESVAAWDGVSEDAWTYEGDGDAHVEDGMLICHTWPRSDKWPDSEARADDAPNGFYATFGSFIPHLDVSSLDLARCNRISFSVKPICPGLHSPIVRVGFTNDGQIKIPDPYAREGFNAVSLRNNEWNHVTWEVDSIAHDRITSLSFNFHRYGKEVSCGDDLTYLLKDIRLERVEPYVVHGWRCAEGRAVYPTTGYDVKGSKTAIANTQEKIFKIVDATSGVTVFEGPVTDVCNDHGVFQVLDFSSINREGCYQVRLGEWTSPSFDICHDIYDTTLWKLLNFLYCERCGYPVPNKHGSCHQDVVAHHDGLVTAFSGGWHDAADVSQQTAQTAEILDSMMSVAENVDCHDHMLSLRLREEANWALDFILRMRLGGGRYVTHAAIRRWTDGRLGNMDDCEADVRQGSFEAFIFASVYAHASSFFKQGDNELSWKCLECAKEDFAYALARFQEKGVEPVHMREHTAGASASQYYSLAAIAASRLYSLTGDMAYSDVAAQMADKVLACQERGVKGGLSGFFYRDETHSAIVHFSHQARDQVFVMALDSCCRLLGNTKDTRAWKEGLKAFGAYLKDLRKFTAPYGMLPAGIHHISEVDDAATFAVLHPDVTHEAEKENYRQQLMNGIDLCDGYYIRTFPVWFSFRGNSAIQLSRGKAASIVGHALGDEELIDIAREQLYWTLGKNPFGQSLVYGEGHGYGRQYTALLGETVGEMPVGVQTRRNEDLPYWPPACIATYREVWTTPVGKWMAIAADLV